MVLEILGEKENKLLERKDLDIEVKHVDGATPSKADIIKEIAKRYSVPEDHVVLKYVFTRKGTNTAVGKAKIYKKPIAVEKTKDKEGGQPKQEANQEEKAAEGEEGRNNRSEEKPKEEEKPTKEEKKNKPEEVKGEK